MKRAKQQLQMISRADEYTHLVWDGSPIKIRRIFEQWLDAGEWWQGEQEKLFLRLQLENDSLLEIYQQVGRDTWHLYKVYD